MSKSDEAKAIIQRVQWRKTLELAGLTEEDWEVFAERMPLELARSLERLTDGELPVSFWNRVIHPSKLLHGREHHARVNVNTMEDVHKIALSASRAPRDRFIKAARDAGYTLRSLSKRLNVSPSTLSAHRVPKTEPNARPCPQSRADEIKKLIGWPADSAHWPAGLTGG